ncbi:MAG: SDR family NAD(P)-dependent oxidoreductase [Ardenticatenaceae bacterium]|nr:SDR family NAD(P)-dependent oxidoreductase [Ardenticatenaceae bacterium]
MQKNILITGATDGIGLELARLYAQQGYSLLLVGRRAQPPAVPGKVLYCRADLETAVSVEQIRLFLQQHGVERLDVLIHNAGVGYYGRLQEQAAQSIEALTAVNLSAPIALTHALLPLVRAAAGQIVFISSVVSTLPTPDYAVYTATKAALDGFARSLRVELRGQATVQVIHPGATRTGMHAKMGISRETLDWETFPAAAAVAAGIATAIARKRPSATIGLKNSLLHFTGRNLSRIIDPRLRRPDTLAAAANRQQRPHCVITGAADGIGRALARQFGRAGYTITGVDVDMAKAQETAVALTAEGMEITFIEADLGQNEGIQQVLAALAERPFIDVFIHNAGINAVGQFAQLPIARQQAVLDVNLRAPLLLTAGILRMGRMNAGGMWVFLSSLSHFVSYPGAAVYAASKDGVASFARSLRAANEGGAAALAVFPGPTRTIHARRYSPDNSREGARMPPAALATAVYQAVQKRQAMFVPGAANRLLALAGRLFPGLLEAAMARTMLAKIGDKVMV